MGAFFKDQGLIGAILGGLEAVHASKLISKGFAMEGPWSQKW
tara:strand:+ start:251 stop:376 length:126 start_codon:yes stop_codon:yes gene_type:complete